MTYNLQFSEKTLHRDLETFWCEASVIGQEARKAPKGDYEAKLQGLADLMRVAYKRASAVRDDGSQFFWVSMRMAAYRYGSDLCIPLFAALLVLQRDKFPVPDEALSDVSIAMVVTRSGQKKRAGNLSLLHQQYH